MEECVNIHALCFKRRTRFLEANFLIYLHYGVWGRYTHGDTIPLIFYVVYDIYSDISEPRDLCYRIMNVLHQIGKKIHGLIHDMTTTHEAYFVEYFDVIWERVCKDIFSMVDYYIRYYSCRKIHSYDSPPSSNDDHQKASPHDVCLQHFDVLMHDLGIHNIFTKSITKKLLFQLIQVKKKTC